MVVYPNAKINLGLHILSKQENGFHDLETVFCPVELSDILEIIPEENGVSVFETTGLPIPGNSDKNLCFKAYKIMKEAHQLPAVKMHLHKVIPMGAGLGGGSSDAAFTIKTLNTIFELNLSEEKMMEYAGMLGSDCPFFIRNKVSFGFGRGEKLEPVNLALSDYHVVIVVPDIHVDTAEAYLMLDNQRQSESFNAFRDIHKACNMKNIIESGPARWSSFVENDFEVPVFSKYPEIQSIKQKLYDRGAMYASMSGSGSAVFGIFREPITDLHDLCVGFVWSGRARN